MKYEYHIIVIGGGSGGLVVASGAAGLGAKVALIEGEKMGGDCLNAGCVPSKSFLRSAHLAGLARESQAYGLTIPEIEVDMPKVMGRVASVIKAIEPHDSKERYEGLGVEVIEGYGSLMDGHSVKVGDRLLTAKNIVVATGSTPFVPPIPGIEGVAYYTNKNIFHIDEVPKKLIVLGAGPIGSELGQGFRHLGSDVTLIDMAPGLFGRDDQEVGPLMKEVFEKEGIVLELGVSVVRVKEVDESIQVTIKRGEEESIVQGDTLLVALGRKPNTKGLNLEEIGVAIGPRGHIETDDKLRSSISNIFAVGDVTGPYAFTHMAGYQAGLVIQNAIFPVKKSVDYRGVPWVTYTKPEVAHVGLTEGEAKKKGMDYNVYKVPMAGNDRARAEGDVQGFLKLITDKKGVLVGGTMVGDKAGEQIGLANLAVLKKMKISTFMSMTFPYPTELDIYKTAALQALRESFKPWQKQLVERLFLG